jgi:hypothetical protein
MTHDHFANHDVRCPVCGTLFWNLDGLASETILSLAHIFNGHLKEHGWDRSRIVTWARDEYGRHVCERT